MNPVYMGIDPGTQESAYAVIEFSPDHTIRLCAKDILPNEALLLALPSMTSEYNVQFVALEMIQSYGMVVGRETFETCFWIGRFYERLYDKLRIGNSNGLGLVFRKDVCSCLCRSGIAGDAAVHKALVGAYGDKGTAKAPGVFYGVKEDIWSACALAVTAYLRHTKEALPCLQTP